MHTCNGSFTERFLFDRLYFVKIHKQLHFVLIFITEIIFRHLENTMNQYQGSEPIGTENAMSILRCLFVAQFVPSKSRKISSL